MDYRPSPHFQPHLASFCCGGSQSGSLGGISGKTPPGLEELPPPAHHPVAVCQQESPSFAELPGCFELGHWPLESPAASHGLLWPLPVAARDTRGPAGKPSAFGGDVLSEFLGGPRSPQHPEPQHRTSHSSEEKSAWRKMRVYQSQEATESPRAKDEDDAVFPEVGAEVPEPQSALEVPRTLVMAGPPQARTKEPERRRFSASELMSRLQSAQRKATLSLCLGKSLTKDRGLWAAREGKAPEKEPSCSETKVDVLMPPAISGVSERDDSWPDTRPYPLEEPAPNALVPHEWRQSRFLLNSVLYQEYSDVASDRELQRQKHEEDTLGEEADEEEGPGPPWANLSPSSSFRAQRSGRGSTFSLWQDIPDVRCSGFLAIIGLQERKLQEAKFELITSEASYIHSLSVAVGHFMGSSELAECLGAQEKQWLFSRLPEVKATSERFLQELEQRLEEDILRFCVCDIVLRHCPAFRRVYLPYVTNQAYQERTYQRLLLENPKFSSILARLEEAPVCQRLPLTSFLILPFQRITRLKMLVENILKRTGQGLRGEDMATKAFDELKKLVQECNASVQSMKRTEELIHLNKKIHFESKIFPLISQSRWLVRHGELVELAPPTMPAVSAAKPKLSTKAIYLHVFNDCLLLSRKKESEKQRWISAMCPSSAQEDKEAISENEDLPQVQCIRAYKALEPDELTLEKADILAVRTRTGDGWLEGIRLADGERGWVPQAYVDEITSRSARLRNIWETRRIESATNKLQETAA
ncbi:rho guanine nucleotide exchange factor 19 isoform X2 [Vombatus ursinus]|uniref:Rho guanine nucleotide exchange factor 19 n=2 Tax=Vombatus ursinus TaxID=29139 RepID=A0A4X2L4K2_VOMUR|nr:rho guanine nucleotide exchange factor 19 isoform X2 [Vombatus ursinus]